MTDLELNALQALALSGQQVLERAFQEHRGWLKFAAVYDGDEKETWSVVGTRYVDLDRAPSYDKDHTIVSGVDQVVAAQAERYLELLRLGQ